MEYKEKAPEPFNEDKIQENIKALIRENKHTSEDVENAYLGITTDTNKDLLEMIQNAFKKGLPMNRIGEIVARMKTENVNTNEKQNEGNKIADKYLAEVHALQFDQASVEILSRVLKEDVQGEYIFKVNSRPFIKTGVDLSMNREYKIQILTGVFTKLKQFQGNYPLSVDFLKS
jgi:transcriptional regulator NrdR family protein